MRVHPDLLKRQRLHPEALGADVWHRRYSGINDWERHLADNGIKVVKLFLNLSREEQRTRFLKRIDLAEKNWKLSAADVAERAHWDEYQHAYSQMLTHTSTEHAPWYVIPADHKWFAHIAAGAVIVQALVGLDPRYPEVSADARRALDDARRELRSQAPTGAVADPFRAGRHAGATVVDK